MTIDRPIVIALIIVIIFLMVFFLVMPEYNTFTSLQTELGEKKAEYGAEFDYYDQIAKTYFILQSRQDDVQKIDNALSTDPNLGRTIYLLQETAKQNGLIVKDLFLSKSSSIDANNPNASGNIKSLVFSMDLMGGYQSLEGFLASLEKSSRIFEVTNISFGSLSGSPYSFSLQIKTYSY